jgi:hypothetical protein
VDELPQPRDQAAAPHLGERQPIERNKVRAQTRERVRRHRQRRRQLSADEIAAERKALQEDREERAKQKRLAPLMKEIGKGYKSPQGDSASHPGR